jgi:hypothetical protein
MKINTYEYQKLRGLKRKYELITKKGGCCEQCGYNKNIAALEFHHKDPTKKEYQLDMRRLSNTSMKKLLIEVEKCELLCSICHRELHSPELEIINVLKLIINLDDSILECKEIGKPKCLDCGCKINYTHKRCVTCNSKNRRKTIRPNIKTLLNEIDTHSISWCGIKYGVSRTTIKRWIKNNENETKNV